MSLPDGLVEGGTEELAAVFTETDACYSFTVGTFKPPQTLTTLDLPHLHTEGLICFCNMTHAGNYHEYHEHHTIKLQKIIFTGNNDSIL